MDGGPRDRRTRGRTRRRRARALAAAVAGVRAADPERVESALREMGARRRLLAPLALTAGTLAVVFDGVLLLVRNWRLILLQLVPAVWIWLMSWNLRTHLLREEDLPLEWVGLIAAGVLVATQVAYWCNATFGFTLLQEGRPRIREAFRRARPRWRVVSGLALAVGGVQAAVWLLLPGWRLSWFWVALLAVFVVQIYLFVAIPAWIVGTRPGGSRRERLARSATTGVLSGIAATPGFVLNRIALLLLGTGSLWIAGVVLLAVAAVLHVTASTSARVVKLSVKLRPAEPLHPDGAM